MSEYPLYFFQGQKIIEKEGILGEVWLSGYHFAKNIQGLLRNKISFVISAVDLEIQYPSSISHHKWDLKDNEDQEIRYIFFPLARLLDQKRKEGNVLIHCAAGISRSVSLLISYMMVKYKASFNSCLAYITKRRPCVKPNVGFVRQLKGFSEDLGIKDSGISLPA